MGRRSPRKFAPQSPVFIFQFLLQKIGDDTIIGIKHLGDGMYEFVLRSPDGLRSTYEVPLA